MGNVKIKDCMTGKVYSTVQVQKLGKLSTSEIMQLLDGDVLRGWENTKHGMKEYHYRMI